MAVCRVGEVDWTSVHLGRWGWGLVWAKGHLKSGLDWTDRSKLVEKKKSPGLWVGPPGSIRLARDPRGPTVLTRFFLDHFCAGPARSSSASPRA